MTLEYLAVKSPETLPFIESDQQARGIVSIKESILNRKSTNDQDPSKKRESAFYRFIFGGITVTRRITLPIGPS